MKELKMYEKYNREEISSIFAPEVNFKKGTGTWGLQGFIRLSDRPNDFVLMVNLGQDSFGYEFDENISENGILTWQSQERHDLNHKYIKSLINHNELINNLYLFISNKEQKQKGQTDYLFLGKIGYLTHDNENENPVHFKFQILNWSDKSKNALRDVGINLVAKYQSERLKENDTIYFTSPPVKQNTNEGLSKKDFISSKNDYMISNEKKAAIGLSGEKLVLKNEKDTLIKQGKINLANKLIHTSIMEGDGAGYDIRSYNSDGTVKYIEVKTTTSGVNTPIYISANEVAFSKINSNSYYLYRIYEYDLKTKTGKCFILPGNMHDRLELTPIDYQGKIL